MHSQDNARQAQELARDWATILASELGAMVDDREAVEFWRAALAWWSSLSTVFANLAQPDDPSVSGPDAPSRAPPPYAAPAAGDERLASLQRRVDELERRLGGRDPPIS